MTATLIRVAPPLSVAAAAESASAPAARVAPAGIAVVAPAPAPPPASGAPGTAARAPATEPAPAPTPSASAADVPAAAIATKPATAADAFASRIDGVATPAAAATATATVAAPTRAPQSPATAGNLGGAVFALVLVVGLILLLSWLARRMPGLGGGRSANPALSIVGSLALGPRDRLVVVDVGGTQLLLGVGAGGTRTLHTLDQPLPKAAERAAPAFAQVLAQHFGKKP